MVSRNRNRNMVLDQKTVDAREEVACRIRAICDKGEYLRQQALLHARFLRSIRSEGVWTKLADAYKLRIEFGQARLAGIVEHQHGVDHVVVRTSTR